MSQQKTLNTHSNDTQTITVPKQEYDRLQAVASHFEMMRNFFEHNPFHPSLQTEILEP